MLFHDGHWLSIGGTLAPMTAGSSRGAWIAREVAANTAAGVPPTVDDPAVLRVLASVWLASHASATGSVPTSPAGGR